MLNSDEPHRLCLLWHDHRLTSEDLWHELSRAVHPLHFSLMDAHQMPMIVVVFPKDAKAFTEDDRAVCFDFDSAVYDELTHMVTVRPFRISVFTTDARQ
ncbi:hypothetical protein C8J56DRAFT_1065327 [Mycena floridula]|nr:hypothetical protein C8J56DRAFT_1065327 [Mycena floridula]